MRQFATGATRSNDDSKPDYEGYLSPLVIEEYGRYMLRNQICEDGSKRASDNWQNGIPREQYIKSAFRHFVLLWKFCRADRARCPEAREHACALLFNIMGWLHETLKLEEGLTNPRQAATAGNLSAIGLGAVVANRLSKYPLKGE